MNIEQAKDISIAEILERLGIQPMRERGQQNWYLSPLRQEKRPSFQVHLKKNIWYDFGDGRGGDVIGFVCAWLQSQGEASTVPDALRWMKNKAGEPIRIAPVAPRSLTTEPESKGLTLKSTGLIEHPALIRYLDERGIPASLARLHVKQAWLENAATGKRFFALAFGNEEGGHELRNPFFKGSLAPKSITFLRGRTPKPDSLHVFEGFMDFLSILASRNEPCLEADAIVLNSLSCLAQATPYIKGYGYKTLLSWMDNDVAGEKAMQALALFAASEPGLGHRPMNESYACHKDVNAWYMHSLKRPALKP